MGETKHIRLFELTSDGRGIEVKELFRLISDWLQEHHLPSDAGMHLSEMYVAYGAVRKAAGQKQSLSCLATYLQRVNGVGLLRLSLRIEGEECPQFEGLSELLTEALAPLARKRLPMSR
jgi:hypothetical protein